MKLWEIEIIKQVINLCLVFKEEIKKNFILTLLCIGFLYLFLKDFGILPNSKPFLKYYMITSVSEFNKYSEKHAELDVIMENALQTLHLQRGNVAMQVIFTKNLKTIDNPLYEGQIINMKSLSTQYNRIYESKNILLKVSNPKRKILYGDLVSKNLHTFALLNGYVLLTTEQMLKIDREKMYAMWVQPSSDSTIKMRYYGNFIFPVSQAAFAFIMKGGDVEIQILYLFDEEAASLNKESSFRISLEKARDQIKALFYPVTE